MRAHAYTHTREDEGEGRHDGRTLSTVIGTCVEKVLVDESSVRGVHTVDTLRDGQIDSVSMDSPSVASKAF